MSTCERKSWKQHDFWSIAKIPFPVSTDYQSLPPRFLCKCERHVDVHARNPPRKTRPTNGHKTDTQVRGWRRTALQMAGKKSISSIWASVNCNPCGLTLVSAWPMQRPATPSDKRMVAIRRSRGITDCLPRYISTTLKTCGYLSKIWLQLRSSQVVPEMNS